MAMVLYPGYFFVNFFNLAKVLFIFVYLLEMVPVTSLILVIFFIKPERIDMQKGLYNNDCTFKTIL